MSNAITAQNELNAKARAEANAAVEGLAVKPTARVEYRSRGRVAVIGGEEAMEFAPRLEAPLHPQVVLLQGAETCFPLIVCSGSMCTEYIFSMCHCRISDCSITEEGYASLASALRLNPNHLTDLDLRGNDPGESGVKLLSDLKDDPKCKLRNVW